LNSQLKEELQSFSDPNQNYSLKLMSAPVIFHMEYDHNFSNYIKGFSSVKDIDCAKVSLAVFAMCLIVNIY
jgi:hypothetical protein